MRPSSRRWVPLGGALAVAMTVAACDPAAGGEGEAPRARPSERPPQATPRSLPPPRALPGPPRVVRVVGEVDALGGTPLRVGALVPHDARVDSGGATLVLDFPGGGRVELGPGTVASIGAESGAQVFVGRGEVRGSVSVSGGSTRPALRIGTPVGTVAIGAAGDLVLRAGVDGTAAAAVLSGSATASRGDEGEGGRPIEEVLQEGQAARLGEDRITVERGGATLEQARARLGTADGEVPLSPAAAEALVATRVGELEACLLRLEELVERGDALRQRGPVAEGAALAARRAEVVEHAQRLGRLRRTCRIRYEMVRAADLLRGAGEPSGVDRERVRRLLGLP